MASALVYFDKVWPLLPRSYSQPGTFGFRAVHLDRVWPLLPRSYSQLRTQASVVGISPGLTEVAVHEPCFDSAFSPSTLGSLGGLRESLCKRDLLGS